MIPILPEPPSASRMVSPWTWPAVLLSVPMYMTRSLSGESESKVIIKMPLLRPSLMTSTTEVGSFGEITIALTCLVIRSSIILTCNAASNCAEPATRKSPRVMRPPLPRRCECPRRTDGHLLAR